MFVTFEGMDGSGKTTQVERLRAALEAEGREVVTAREPGQTALGEAIRNLVLHGGADDAVGGGAPLRRLPRRGRRRGGAPALERGADVLLDRYLDSSIVYQGIGRGLGVDEVLELNLLADRRPAARPDVRARDRAGHVARRASAPSPTGSSARTRPSTRASPRATSSSQRSSRSASSFSTARSTRTLSPTGSRMSFAGLPEQPEARPPARGRGRRGAGARVPASTGRRGSASARPRAPSRPRCSATSGVSQAGTHPDLFLLEALGEMIRIDEVRALHRDLHMRPYEAERRVYVIADAHLLNEDAADALLKDLEEPPPYAVIVLVADELGPLPPTIRSRCQLVPFRRLPERAVRAFLAERAPGLSENEARALARVSGGRLDRAERLLDPEAQSRRDELLRVARAPYAEPELDPADAAATLLESPGRPARRARARAEAELEGIELTARESEQRLRRVQRGAEREELLASLEELASWYRDLVVVAAGAEQAAVHADRLDVLREDATPSGPRTPRPPPSWRGSRGGRSRSSTSTRRSRSRRSSSACSGRSAAPWPPGAPSVLGLRRLLPPFGSRCPGGRRKDARMAVVPADPEALRLLL